MKSPVPTGMTDTITCVSSWRMTRSSWCREKEEGRFRWRKCLSKGRANRSWRFGGRGHTTSIKDQNTVRALNATLHPETMRKHLKNTKRHDPFLFRENTVRVKMTTLDCVTIAPWVTKTWTKETATSRDERAYGEAGEGKVRSHWEGLTGNRTWTEEEQHNWRTTWVLVSSSVKGV